MKCCATSSMTLRAVFPTPAAMPGPMCLPRWRSRSWPTVLPGRRWMTRGAAVSCWGFTSGCIGAMKWSELPTASPVCANCAKMRWTAARHCQPWIRWTTSATPTWGSRSTTLKFAWHCAVPWRPAWTFPSLRPECSIANWPMSAIAWPAGSSEKCAASTVPPTVSNGCSSSRAGQGFSSNASSRSSML
ncbi:hypothetical protein D3C79_766670 [compost metagenome]